MRETGVIAYEMLPMRDLISWIMSSVGSTLKSLSVRQNPGSIGVLYCRSGSPEG
jgi:hypothetical protein